MTVFGPGEELIVPTFHRVPFLLPAVREETEAPGLD